MSTSQARDENVTLAECRLFTGGDQACIRANTRKVTLEECQALCDEAQADVRIADREAREQAEKILNKSQEEACVQTQTLCDGAKADLLLDARTALIYNVILAAEHAVYGKEAYFARAQSQVQANYQANYQANLQAQDEIQVQAQVEAQVQAQVEEQVETQVQTQVEEQEKDMEEFVLSDNVMGFRSSSCKDNGCPCISCPEDMTVYSFGCYYDIHPMIFHQNGRGAIVRIRSKKLAPNDPCDYVVTFESSMRKVRDFEVKQIDIEAMFPMETHHVSDVPDSDDESLVRRSRTSMRREMFFHLPENKEMKIKIYKKMNKAHARLACGVAFFGKFSSVAGLLDISTDTNWSDKQWLQYDVKPIKRNGYRQVSIQNAKCPFHERYYKAYEASWLRDNLSMREYYEKHYDPENDEQERADGLTIEYTTEYPKGWKGILIQAEKQSIHVDQKNTEEIVVTMSLAEFFNNYHAIAFLLKQIENAK